MRNCFTLRGSLEEREAFIIGDKSIKKDDKKKKKAKKVTAVPTSISSSIKKPEEIR
jgi:hypothetical protein